MSKYGNRQTQKEPFDHGHHLARGPLAGASTVLLALSLLHRCNWFNNICDKRPTAVKCAIGPMPNRSQTLDRIGAEMTSFCA
jgi:hypothetical protein